MNHARQDMLLGIAMVVLALAYLAGVVSMEAPDLADPIGPKTFPYLLAACVMACGFAVLSKSASASSRRTDRSATDADSRPLEVSLMLVGMVAYLILLAPLGYLLATFMFLLSVMAFFNRGRWVANIFAAAAFPIFMYTLVGHFVELSLPQGILPF